MVKAKNIEKKIGEVKVSKKDKKNPSEISLQRKNNVHFSPSLTYVHLTFLSFDFVSCSIDEQPNSWDTLLYVSS